MSRDVADYYDRATRAFLSLGHGRKLGVIHRAVWGPGVRTRAQALRFIESQILRVCPKGAGLLDLGCGVGSSLAFLMERVHDASHGLGVTLSAEQVAIGRERLQHSLAAPRIELQQANYTSIDLDGRSFDVAYAIESFVHGTDVDAFFAEAARALRPGGRLIICDDHLSDLGAHRSDDPRVQRFVKGWRVSSLLTFDALVEAASRAGLRLESSQDWSRWLELRRPRDRLISVGVALTRGGFTDHPWWGSMAGGDGLQQAIIAGLIQFRCTIFGRP